MNVYSKSRQKNLWVSVRRHASAELLCVVVVWTVDFLIVFAAQRLVSDVASVAVLKVFMSSVKLSLSLCWMGATLLVVVKWIWVCQGAAYQTVINKKILFVSLKLFICANRAQLNSLDTAFSASMHLASLSSSSHRTESPMKQQELSMVSGFPLQSS